MKYEICETRWMESQVVEGVGELVVCLGVNM